MSNHQERRNESRKKVMAFIPVRDMDEGKLLGYLQDLTLKGVLIVGERSMAVDEKLNLDIELPGELPGVSTSKFSMSARVARCETEKGDPVSYRTGLEFTNIQPTQQQIIEALLERYHFRYKKY